MPQSIGPQVRVVRYDAYIKTSDRKVIDNPRLRVAVAQTLRKRQVEVWRDILAERHPVGGILLGGGYFGRIASQRLIFDAAKPDGVEPHGTTRKSQHLTGEVAQHLCTDECRVIRREIFKRASREKQRGHLRLTELRSGRRA